MADKQVVTVEEACSHIPIDEPTKEIKKIVERLILVADQYLKGAIHSEYKKDDERARMVALLIIEDLYMNRSLTEKDMKTNTRKLVSSMCLQMKAEMLKDG